MTMELQNPASETVRHPLPSDLIHDLRTPLNHILGYSEMLIEQAQELGQQDLVPDLRKTHTAGERLLALINEHFLPVHTPLPPAEFAVPGEPETADEPSSDRSEAAQGSLLVVDDVEANRDVLSRRLRRQGYTVATADNGREALEKLRADAFDLVLLDIMMPEMDGYEVLQRLKADEALRHLPVIMISALNELDSVVRCIEMGAEDYLPKPFNPTLLKARIGATLEKKRTRDREKQLFLQLQDNHQRLQALEKLRDDLTHMIIHDLRTPLNAMFLGLEAVKAMGDLNEDQVEMLGITIGGGKTLIGIVNDLLDISKMEDASLALDCREVAVADLIAGAVQQVTPLACEKSLALEVELASGLPRLVADPAHLLRIVVNLLANAIKFTPTGGIVTVAVRPDDDSPALRFSVSDTGEGIPPEAFERIFEKFGQVASRRGGRTMSTGLGLAYCKLAVEAHGGRITVESEPDHGSTFYFTIPLSLLPAVPSAMTNVSPTRRL